MEGQAKPSVDEGVTIVYDGECPFCSDFVRRLRLQETLGTVTLINARDAQDSLVRDLKERYVLDNGFVVLWQGQEHYGGDAMHLLAMLSTPSPLFNRLFRGIFLSTWVSSWMYPILVVGRKFVLWLMGRRLLGY